MPAITVPDGAMIKAEIIEGDRAVETCESAGIVSRLILYGTDGTTELVNDTTDGRSSCSMIDGRGVSTRVDANASAMVAGTYYLRVGAATPTGTTASGQFIYKLAVMVMTP